ncbi:MAG: two-component system response regulator NarL [Porticoccus sp.]
MKNNTVLLVDDHPILRKGIKDLIELEDNISVVGEAANGDDAVKEAVQKSPSLILLDLRLKGMSGLDVLKALRNSGVDSRVVIFSGSDDEDDVIQALRAGADGFLSKDLGFDDLIVNIRRACEGKMVFSDDLLHIIATAFRKEKLNKKSDVSHLTSREKQTLKCIANGMSNKKIAQELDIALPTVKVHVKHVYKKLGLTSRVEAAVWVLDKQIS